MPFFERLYASVVLLKTLPDFRLKIISAFLADIGDLAPGVEMCWRGVNFPRDLKCQILSSLTLEIAFKRRLSFSLSLTAYPNGRRIFDRTAETTSVKCPASIIELSKASRMSLSHCVKCVGVV